MTRIVNMRIVKWTTLWLLSTFFVFVGTHFATVLSHVPESLSPVSTPSSDTIGFSGHSNRIVVGICTDINASDVESQWPFAWKQLNWQQRRAVRNAQAALSRVSFACPACQQRPYGGRSLCGCSTAVVSFVGFPFPCIFWTEVWDKTTHVDCILPSASGRLIFILPSIKDPVRGDQSYARSFFRLPARLGWPLNVDWFLCFVNINAHAATMGAVFLFGHWCIRASRRRRRVCASCAYDQRGLMGRVCPECGRQN
jgi:hypothetical protein